MHTPPDAKSVRKRDGRIEITRVALGVAGGLRESNVRGRVNRGVKRNFQSLTPAEKVNALHVGTLEAGLVTLLFTANPSAKPLSGISPSLPATG
jgi:hypothetical protein